MSFSTGVRERPNVDMRAVETILEADQQFIQRMKPFNAESPGTGFVSTGDSGGTAASQGASLLDNAGALLNGAIGYVQEGIDLVNETISVSVQDFDEQWTSFTNITNALTDDILDLIDGGDYSGQILKVRIPDGVSDFIIHNANKVGNTTSNILMAGVNDLTVQGGEIIEFIYDIFTAPQSGAKAKLKAGTLAGVWRLSGTGGVTPGLKQGLIASLSTDQLANFAIGEHIEYDTNSFTRNGLVVSTGVGQANGIVSGFLAGKSYSIRIGGAFRFGANTGSVTFQLKIETGSGLLISTEANGISVQATGQQESFLPTIEGFFEPSADTDTISVQFTSSTSVSAVISGLTVGDPTTYLIIEDLTSGGTSGGGGGGGTGLTNPLTENLDIDGYNTILDIDGDTFWKGERDGLADDWIQLVIGGNGPPTQTVAINVSNRTGNEYVRIGLNLEPNGSSQTLGTLNQKWNQEYINEFVSFDNFAGSIADSGEGRIYWNNTTKHFNQIDDAGGVLDLAASGDLSGWANFPAVADVVPDAVGRLLGSTIADEQWGGLFLDPSVFIRWETSLGVFTETFIQGTTGGINYGAPSAGAHSFLIGATEEFKVSNISVDINTPVLDFNDSTATIQDLQNLLYNTAGGRIIAEASHNSLGAGLVLDTDVSASTFFQVGGIDAMRLHHVTDKILEMHPDTGELATEIRQARSISFDGDGVIATNKATVSATAAEDLNLTVAVNRGINMYHNAVETYVFGQQIMNLQNGVGVIQFIPTAGNAFTIEKQGGAQATFRTADDFIFDNPSSVNIFDLRGDFGSTGLVPVIQRFRGKNSVGSFETYAEIRARIALNTSGAEQGDLEFYIAEASNPRLTMALEANGFVTSTPTMTMRGNIELLSSVGAEHLILNQTDINFTNLAFTPAVVSGQDAALYTIDLGSGTELRITFANGTTKILATDS